MAKRWFLLGAILLLSLIVVGCGVAQSEYDAAVAERDAVVSSLAAKQAELESVQNDLSASQSEMQSLQDEISAQVAQLSEAENRIEQLQAEGDPAKLKRLFFFVTVFCSEEPEIPEAGPTQYKAKPDNTYKINETIWLYIEFGGWKWVLVDHKIEIDVEAEFRLKDDKGSVLEKWTPIMKDETEVGDPFASYWLGTIYEDLEVGSYTVEVILKDNNSEETATWEGEFRVTQ